MQVLTCDLRAIHSLAFSPDGRFLAAAGGSGSTGRAGRVYVWDLATGEPTRYFQGAAGRFRTSSTPPTAVTCSPRRRARPLA